jgi:hypothetical protein
VVIGAMLTAASIAGSVTTRSENTGPWPHPGLVRASLVLGLLLCVMFLFRRWYAFSALGIVIALLMVLTAELWRNENSRAVIAARTLAAMILICLAVLAFLAPVMFDWAKALEEHDFLRTYSSYARPLTADLAFFGSKFGIVAPAFAVVFYLLARRLNLDRLLLFILCGSSVISCILFFQVQSPGPHHYYLLMPLLGAGLAGMSQVLARKRGLSASLVLGVVLVVSGIGMTTFVPQGAWLTMALPNFKDWLPKQQPGMHALSDLGTWLLSPELKSRRFCILASSELVNQSLLEEVWQIAPLVPKQSFSGRLVHLGNVDSRDGPPSGAFRQCEIALVGSPLQTHLPDGEQYSVQILQEDLLKGTGVGAAYEKLPEVFVIDNRASVLAYRRTRELTPEEYQDLVRRFTAGKAARAALRSVFRDVSGVAREEP